MLYTFYVIMSTDLKSDSVSLYEHNYSNIFVVHFLWKSKTIQSAFIHGGGGGGEQGRRDKSLLHLLKLWILL